MTDQTLTTPFKITLYCLALLCPMFVYVYFKKIKRGVMLSTVAIVVTFGITAIIVTYNYTLEQLIMLVIVQVSMFVYLVFDAIKLIKK